VTYETSEPSGGPASSIHDDFGTTRNLPRYLPVVGALWVVIGVYFAVMQLQVGTGRALGIISFAGVASVILLLLG
jgi:hypothetical protein